MSNTNVLNIPQVASANTILAETGHEDVHHHSTEAQHGHVLCLLTYNRLMSDYEVTLVNDNSTYASVTSPAPR
jgi:hypothetical protein